MRRARITVDVASLVAAVVLLVAGVLLARANRNEALAWQWVTHTREVLERLQQVVSLVRTAESAQRGYLLTWHADRLAEMREAQAAVPRTIDAVATLTQDNARQQAAIPELRRLAGERFDVLAAVIAGGRSGALDAEGLQRGSDVMAALGQRVAAMMAEEERLLALRDVQVRSARQVEFVTMAAVAVLALALVGVLRAVSRRDARLIEQAASRAAAVFRAAPAGVGIVDAGLRLAEMNDALAQFFGTNREAALGRQPADLHAADTGRQLQAICAAILSSGAPASGVELIQHTGDDRQRDWLASFHPVPGANRLAGVVMAVLEVTPLKQAERELAQANRLLESRVAERTAQLSLANEDLQAFAHTVAHDLRAPLRNIEGFASALIEDEAAHIGESGHMYLRRIQAGVGRMDQLITDLLTYSRLARGGMALERVSLASTVTQALRELDTSLQERQAQIDVQPALPQVVANRSLMVQVLVNLLSNAIKFVPEGTRPSVRIEAAQDGSSVRLAVSDNGIGIPPQHRERVFGVFERLHGQETFAGTGIGLAIVRRAVVKMNGTVAVEDSLLGGVRLVVVLPAAD